jgi:hypothetical protein
VGSLCRPNDTGDVGDSPTPGASLSLF